MTSPKVLMATFEYWDSPYQVGAHHLARAFAAEGWDVGYVSDPISPLHLLGDRGRPFRTRVRDYQAGGQRDPSSGVWHYVPGALLTPRRDPVLRSRWLHGHWHTLTFPSLLSTLVKAGFADVDILYVDRAVHEPWLRRIASRRSVLRLADRTSAFAHVAPQVLDAEHRLARSVDAVAISASTLEPYAMGLGAKRVIHIPNGVDFDALADGDASLPTELASLPRPIAIYVGAIGDWFDADLVAEAASALPDVSFVLIGDPSATASGRLSGHTNVYVLGPRPHSTITRYLRNADIGLIPFDVAGRPELVHSIHPLKLYEYLACGLPVVATRWDELERIDSPAVLVDTVAGFVDAIRTAGASTDRAGGASWARQADWRGRVRLLVGALR